MNVNVINNTNVKVTVNQSDDGTFSILIFDENQKKQSDKPLGKVAPGKTVKIGKREYIVLGHGTDTTALITKEFVKEARFDEKTGDYAASEIRQFLNNNFYKELCNAVGADNVVKHTVNLTANDGTGKGNYVKDNVSLLTADLYRRYREYLPAYGNWWWLATPFSKEDGYALSVCCVRGDGALGWDDCGWSSGVRPFCILSSSILNFDEV